jgi:ABC-type dipeptide/oligopeptide/nickel transport system permease subunit
MRQKSLFLFNDTRWSMIWLLTVGILAVWDTLFLNAPALKQVVVGFYNTFVIAFLVISMTLLLGWIVTLAQHRLKSGGHRGGYLVLSFLLNLFRSVPQVVGILLGYVGVGICINRGIVHSGPAVYCLLAACMSLFIFIEMVDCMSERITHYQKLDFYNAMRVCGISENRIINFNILWKNSRIHVFNKLIAVLGSAVFLQCSVDFIVSVGLSTKANEVTLPPTLGNLLANIDSKQDILAIGYTLTHPAYAGNLFFQHLQGITAAFLIVFTLLCVYKISNGFAERHRL